MRSPSLRSVGRIMVYLQLVLGFVLLVAGGEALVRGAVSVATRFGVSPLLIGLTLVGFGTSTPELVTSLQAAFAGLPGIAIGNVVGSNLANILLILGVAAAIMPIVVDPVAFRRDGTALAVATVLAVGVILLGSLDRWMGAVLLTALAIYLIVAYRSDRAAHPGGFGYTWFCTHYDAWKGRVRPTMRQTYVGGEKVFVDFAGDTIDVIDPGTGEVRAMKLFVAASRRRRASGTTGASNYTYAEAVASEGLEDWIGAHVRMFAFLGGVPKVVVPPSRQIASQSPAGQRTTSRQR